MSDLWYWRIIFKPILYQKIILKLEPFLPLNKFNWMMVSKNICILFKLDIEIDFLSNQIIEKTLINLNIININIPVCLMI